ncbi:M56 family metallopeptidase, partial [Methylocapsa sp. S129]|uniref:M56 family metallopeptidase n=1 Tax=Methylocapsa sp. S129 TaxID=1641869 RepID=UPI00131DB521
MVEALLEAALRTLVLTIVVWFGLRTPPLRNPRVQLAAWTIVLIVSLSMPIASRIVAAILPPVPLSATGLDRMFPSLLGGLDIRPEMAPPATSAAAANASAAAGGAANLGALPQATGAGDPSFFDWRSLALFAYAAAAGIFLARLIVGLAITGRIVWKATPLRESWTGGRDIRVSLDIKGPATFGSIILLPLAYAEWPQVKRAAVVAHEAAHVRRGDFYVQLAASVNRAIFWFNPLSWWLRRRLSELAEAVSDDEAIGDLCDRPLYAQILLEMASGSPILPSGIPMARPATLPARIERILADPSAPTPFDKRARAVLLAAILPIAAIVASPLAASSTGVTQDEATTMEQQQAPHPRITIDSKLLDADVGFYEDRASGSVMTVTREDDHLLTRRTGKSPVAEYPYTEHDFFQAVAVEQDAFITDASGNVTRAIHRKYGLTTVFERITPEAAAQLEADFDRRVAEELTPHTPIKVDASVLDRYVGIYQLTSIYYFSITREGDQLFAQGTDQKKFAVYPYSDQDFFYTVVAAQLTF